MNFFKNSRVIFPVIISAGVAGLSIGLTIPLTSIVLENRGASIIAVGLNTAAYSLAVLLIGPFFPFLIHKIGVLKSMIFGALFSGALVFSLSLTNLLWVWFLLRFLMGLSGGLNWVSSEAWIIKTAPEKSRGRVIGIYSMVWAMGIAIGPILLKSIGVNGNRPFLISGCIMISAVLPLLIVPNIEFKISKPTQGIVLKMMKNAPIAAGAVFVGGYMEMAVLSLLPVYAIQTGIEISNALVLLSCFTIGGFLFQPIIGWVSDKLPSAALVLMVTGVSILITFFVPASLNSLYLAGPLLFIWGGIIASYYTLGMIFLGRQFKGSDLTAASSMLVFAYTSGMVTGPLLCSMGMKFSVTHGLIAALTLIPIIFVILLLYKYFKPVS
jgi:MFS family permease